MPSGLGPASLSAEGMSGAVPPPLGEQYVLARKTSGGGALERKENSPHRAL